MYIILIKSNLKLYNYYSIMKIKKIGHCCLLIETGGLKILTDPGNFSDQQNSLIGIDAILITHEHKDHCHVDSIKEILENNPLLRIITNSSVGKLLEEEGINYEIVEDMEMLNMNGVLIEGFGCEHAKIHDSVRGVLVTGYFISDKFYYPGDSFHVPPKKVEILALPIEGPWMKLSDALDYAELVKPKYCFPVHDARLDANNGELNYRLPFNYLNKKGIKFDILKNGESIEYS